MKQFSSTGQYADHPVRGEHYRLRSPTLAIVTSADDPDHQVPVTIPQNGVVELVEICHSGSRLAEVRWDGRLVMMFTADLRERGDRIRAREIFR